MGSCAIVLAILWYDTSPSGFGTYEGEAAIREFITAYLGSAFDELHFDVGGVSWTSAMASRTPSIASMPGRPEKCRAEISAARRARHRVG